MEYLIIGEKKDLETNIFRKLNNLKIKQCYLSFETTSRTDKKK